MHNYALREYWNPTVHSPSTVKNYFYNHKTILQKENIPSLLTTSFNIYLQLLIALIFFSQVINISHFDPIDPNMLIPFMPTVFHTVRLFWGPTCVGLHPSTPTRAKFNHWAKYLNSDKKYFLGQIIQNYVHKNTSHLSPDFNLYIMLLNLSWIWVFTQNLFLTIIALLVNFTLHF
jgi:hypothetical protein